MYKTTVAHSIAKETSNHMFKETYDDVKFKLKMTSYSLGGIDLVRDQATQISFKKREENPDSFLEHFHDLAGRVGPVWATGIGRVGPVSVSKINKFPFALSCSPRLDII